MAFNRQWLRDQIASYLKDRSLGSELDVWIDIAAKRVSQELECFEMETELQNQLRLETTDDIDGGFAGSVFQVIVDGGTAFDNPDERPAQFILIPDKLIRLISIQTLDDGEWRNLRAVPKHQAYAYKSQGLPQVYYVEDRKYWPAPFAEGFYRAIYLREIEVPVTPDEETAVLTSYPYLLLNACLAEAWDWKQDMEMSRQFEGKWRQEAAAVTAVYRGETNGETPAMRAI